MAGLLRRKVPDSPDAQSLLADIISEAKLANAIVVEMLEFVRPIRLQVEHTDVARACCTSAMTLAGRKARARRRRGGRSTSPADLPQIDGDHHQLCQVFTNLLINAFEAIERQGPRRDRGALGAIEVEDPALAASAAPRRSSSSTSPTTARACRRS